MSKFKLIRFLPTEAGLLTVLAVAAMMLFGIMAPASAQFFPFFGGGQQQYRQPPQRGGGGGGWFGGNDDSFFRPFRERRPPPQRAPERREDYSRAPPPEKRDTPATRNVLVLGDAMADWLGYGLEDAFNETPEMGVIRKHKTVSGLIRYQPKGEPADWAAAAKEILATENPDAIVVMLGLHDRMAIHEPAPDKKDLRTKPDGKKADTPDDDAADANSDDKSDDAAADDQDDPDLQNSAPGKSARSPNGIYKFREDRWVELYTKKIDEMIQVLKSKGVPVLWVGLPAVRGTKSTSDMLFLDSLYRDAAGKAGITYVDVWEGFVDEGGRYMLQGPDFEGQTRRLRSYDGVYFTKAGARKLAHYVDREITRLLAGRSAPIALPTEPGTPGANAEPDGPAPRPIAGPVIPLVESSVGTNDLLGGPGSRPVATDALVTRTLVKGDPLAVPAGRADDSSWPRRPIGRERAGDPVVASVPAAAEHEKAKPVAAAEKPKNRRPVRSTDRRPVYSEPAQRRNPMPPPLPPGPAEWLSNLFR